RCVHGLLRRTERLVTGVQGAPGLEGCEASRKITTASLRPVARYAGQGWGDVVAAAEDRPSRGGHAWFSTTHWSVVLKARSPDEAESRDALATLCQAYWVPVYSFVRYRG